MTLDRSSVVINLSSPVSSIPSWKITSGLLDKCIIFNDSDDTVNLQDTIDLENCVLLEKVEKSDEKCDNVDGNSCHLTVSLNESEADKWRFSGFSLLASAKYVELHVKSSREYSTLLKGELIDSVDDMVMVQFDHRLYPRPDCFHLTIIPRDSSDPKIWLYGILIKTCKYFASPLLNQDSRDKESTSERKDNSDDFFIKMMCQMMTKHMDLRRR